VDALYLQADGTQSGDNNLGKPGTLQFKPRLSWDNGKQTDIWKQTPLLQWGTDNPGLVTVGQDGTVTVNQANRTGTARVTLTTVGLTPPATAAIQVPIKTQSRVTGVIE
jgi:hypothetical protein